MFRIPPAGQNDVFKMGPGRGQVLSRDEPICLHGKSDEYAHEKKNDYQADMNDEPFPQIFLSIAGAGLSAIIPPLSYKLSLTIK